MRFFLQSEEETVVFSDPVMQSGFNFLSPFSSQDTRGLQTRKERKLQTQPILESFICQMMRTQYKTGAKEKCAKVLAKAFELLRSQGLNPLQIFVDAIINASPKEYFFSMIVRGSRLKSSAEVSPTKRIDLALSLFGRIYSQSIFRNVSPPEKVLADLLRTAATRSSSSPIIKKVDEIERIAKLSR